MLNGPERGYDAWKDAALLDSDPAYGKWANEYRKGILDLAWDEAERGFTPPRILKPKANEFRDWEGRIIYGLQGQRMLYRPRIVVEVLNLFTLNHILEGRDREDDREHIGACIDQRIAWLVHGRGSVTKCKIKTEAIQRCLENAPKWLGSFADPVRYLTYVRSAGG